MRRFIEFRSFKQFNQNVWLLMSFNYLNRLGFFISIPYLAFYLSYLNYTPVLIGVIVASQALSYSLCSIFCGYLSDRFGKKHAMVCAMLVSAIASFGLAQAHSGMSYIYFNILVGMSRSLFDAAMPAYLTDITPIDTHRFIFNLRFLIINLAGATGPLIGVYYASHHLHNIFNISAIIYLLSAVLIQWQLHNDYNANTKKQQTISLTSTFKMLINDKILLMVVIGTMLYWFIYIQLEAPFAQILQHRNPGNATWLFGLMWMINTIMIVLLQLPIATWTKNLSLIKMIYLGGVLFVISFVGLAFYTSTTAFIVCIALITFGEILYSPICNIVIADIAPSEMRGSYFGAISLCSIGTAIGPVIGGLLIQYSTSEILFLTMAVLSILIIVCYRQSLKMVNLRSKTQKNRPSNVELYEQ